MGISNVTCRAVVAAIVAASVSAPTAAGGQHDAGVVIAWNALAHDIAFAEDQFLTFKGHRALAMMHLAMHDALNSVVPVYRRYALRGPRVKADPSRAAAYAAFEVLASQYPQQADRLAAELSKWTSSAGGRGHSQEQELGRSAAKAVLEAREGDGFDLPGTYVFGTGPGVYQTTPPWNGFVAQPGFRFARPFAVPSVEALRADPPPALAGAEYARAFNEVKTFGSANSTARTEDQTGYAVWWMEFAEGSVNRVARELAAKRRTDLWTAARTFALLNVALFDAYVAVWDSKYEYNHWRPYTAVREAAQDGNAQTSPDMQWEPLRPTPPTPEYVSAHAAGCAASFGILRRTYGDRVAFTMTTTTAPPGMPTRSFTSFSSAVRECADSRVRLGWHFRYAVDAGRVLGSTIARYADDHLLQPRGRRTP